MDGLITCRAANPVAEPTPREEAPGRLSLGMRLANLLAVLLPFLALGAAIVFLWGWGLSWVDLGLLLGMYLSQSIGRWGNIRRFPGK